MLGVQALVTQGASSLFVFLALVAVQLSFDGFGMFETAPFTLSPENQLDRF